MHSPEDFTMNDVRIIKSPYKASITESMASKDGYEIKTPYIGNALIPRIFREIHFRLNLPFKSIWYNRENIIDKKFFYIFQGLITPDYIKWLKRKNPNSKIFIYYGDKVNKANDPEKFDDSLCEKWTSDKYDAEKYNMHILKSKGEISYFHCCKVIKTEPEFDIFFIGRDKGRLKNLMNLKKVFEDLGLKTFFYIAPARRFLFKPKMIYKPLISYEKNLEFLGKTRAILFLSQGAQSGITMRVIESLWFEIKLITDNKDLMNYDFYRPNNIFILGVDDIQRLPEFLNAPYEKVEFKKCYFEDTVRKIITSSE